MCVTAFAWSPGPVYGAPDGYPVVHGERMDTSARKLYHSVELDVRPGYVFQTHEFLKGENSAGRPIRSSSSLHMKYLFSFGPDSYLGRVYPHVCQGVGVSFNKFSNTGEIGRPVALYVFQDSRLASLSDRVALNYEWNFGASFGWKPYDETPNRYNRVVGSRVNAYMSLGIFLDWNLGKRWDLTAGASLTHYSNGNTSYPNAGVNLLEGRLGLSYAVTGRKPETDRGEPPAFRRHISYDIVLYGALRKKGFYLSDGNPYVAPGSFAVAGIDFNPMYSFNRFLKAGLSVDAQYDESANIKDHLAGYPVDSQDMKFYRPPFREQFSVGLSLRAEIVMPIFSINIGIGRNVVCRGEDTDVFYQMLILKARFTRNAFLHVGYRLSRFRDPSHLMLGIGYSFNNRR